MLWLCIHLPNLPLEVLTRGGPANGPLAVSDGQGRNPLILACNGEAKALGVRAGMALGAALALASALRVSQREPEAEEAALGNVAAWAGQFTPVVSLAPPHGVLLEVAGSLALFGGMDRLVGKAREGMAALGYHATLSIAPTPLGATLLARAACEEHIREERTLARHLARLPLEVLGLVEVKGATLKGMGLNCIGDLLRLPVDGLAQRFGPELPRILDQALGRLPDPRARFEAKASFAHELALPMEVEETEPLLFAAHRLLLELTGLLQARCAGVRTLEWRLFHRQQPATCLHLELVAPSRNAQHLLILTRERFERLALAHPVITLGLLTQAFIPLPGYNLACLPVAGGEENLDWRSLIERLRARLGADAVRGFCLLPAHRPEAAWRFCAPGESLPVVHFGKRPLWLLAEPILLRSCGHRPYLDGVLALGPNRERIESGWWEGKDVSRDYFIAQNSSGARFWIFQELGCERHWFLHGLFG